MAIVAFSRPEVEEAVEAAVRRAVRVDLVVVGVLAGQDRRARRAAERQGDEGVGERQPLGGDLVAHGGHEVERAEEKVLVVGEDEDDVRPGGALSTARSVLGDGRPGRGEAGGEDQQKEDREEGLGSAVFQQ